MDMQHLADRYIALWNEPDRDRRRTELVALWAPDGLHHAKSHTCHGYQALEERVTRSYERSIAPGVHVFVAAADVDGHHDVLRVRWHMKRKADDHVVATGCDVLVCGADGRIAADYQFIIA